MKKRKAYAIIACILACILISGCGSKEKEAKWQDGYYTAIMGVAITGGEPKLQPDLDIFMRKIRDLGFQIKLDTNGYRPEVLKRLCGEGLVDYVAMDIKTCKERYSEVAGIPFRFFRKERTCSSVKAGGASFPRSSLLWQKGHRKLQPPVNIVAAT